MAELSYATDAAFLDEVLRPYKAHCKYLKSAEVSSRDGRVSTRCDFQIPESCYIDDTGHLNSVEVNICYNQVLYYTLAASVRWGLLGELADWTMDDFWKRQLPDVLIARFSSRFQRPVNARRFEGIFEFHSVDRRTVGDKPPMLVATTGHRYWDDAGGRCGGEATVTLLNLPQ